MGGKAGFGMEQGCIWDREKRGIWDRKKTPGFGMGQGWIESSLSRDPGDVWNFSGSSSVLQQLLLVIPGGIRGFSCLWSVGIGNVSSLDLLLTFPWQPRPRRISSGGNKRLEAGKDIPGVLLTGRNSGMEPLRGGSRWIWQEHNSRGMEGTGNWKKRDRDGPRSWAGFGKGEPMGMRWERGFGIYSSGKSQLDPSGSSGTLRAVPGFPFGIIPDHWR